MKNLKSIILILTFSFTSILFSTSASGNDGSVSSFRGLDYNVLAVVLLENTNLTEQERTLVNKYLMEDLKRNEVSNFLNAFKKADCFVQIENISNKHTATVPNFRDVPTWFKLDCNETAKKAKSKEKEKAAKKAEKKLKKRLKKAKKKLKKLSKVGTIGSNADLQSVN